MHFIADDLLFALHHVANIHLVQKNIAYCFFIPQTIILLYLRIAEFEALFAFIGSRVWYTKFIEPLDDPALAHPLINKPVKYIPDDFSGFFVYH